MRYRPLGSSGLRVSQLFLGAMTFADGFTHGAAGPKHGASSMPMPTQAATSSTPDFSVCGGPR